jgi:acetoin utilization deacetylase AcuC-like enzyme
MGFCLFNNIAIAARQLVEQGKRVLIFDLDVHHGNGTQDIFYDTDKVLYQSFHLSPHFPWTGDIEEIGTHDGEGYTVNAPLPRKTGKQTVQRLFDELFIPIGKQFNPDIILVSSGYDSHHADQLGGIHLDIDYFGTMIQLLQHIQKKMAVTIEGGYNPNVIGDCFVSQMSTLQGTPIYFEDTTPPSIEAPTVISDLKKQMDPYWDL